MPGSLPPVGTGRHPRTPGALLNMRGASGIREPHAQQFTRRLGRDLGLARQNLERARTDMAKWANKKRRPHEFSVGDEVMLRTANLNVQDPGLARKLQDKWIGPFVVDAVINPVAMKIARGVGCSLPPSYKFHPVVHVHWLKPYRDGDSDFPHRAAKGTPPPLWFERDNAGNTLEVYTVDRLVDRRVRNGVTEYLVKWRGYDDEEQFTWEPIHSLLKGGSTVRGWVHDWEERERRIAEFSTRQRVWTQAAKGKRSTRSRKAASDPPQSQPNAAAPVENNTAAVSDAPVIARRRTARGKRGHKRSRSQPAELPEQPSLQQISADEHPSIDTQQSDSAQQPQRRSTRLASKRAQATQARL